MNDSGHRRRAIFGIRYVARSIADAAAGLVSGLMSSPLISALGDLSQRRVYNMTILLCSFQTQLLSRPWPRQLSTQREDRMLVAWKSTLRVLDISIIGHILRVDEHLGLYRFLW